MSRSRSCCDLSEGAWATRRISTPAGLLTLACPGADVRAPSVSVGAGVLGCIFAGGGGGAVVVRAGLLSPVPSPPEALRRGACPSAALLRRAADGLDGHSTQLPRRVTAAISRLTPRQHRAEVQWDKMVLFRWSLANDLESLGFDRLKSSLTLLARRLMVHASRKMFAPITSLQIFSQRHDGPGRFLSPFCFFPSIAKKGAVKLGTIIRILVSHSL